MQNGTVAKMTTVPTCDFCDAVADYDFRTYQGPFAFGCRRHYLEHRASVRLGVGNGQKLIFVT